MANDPEWWDVALLGVAAVLTFYLGGQRNRLGRWEVLVGGAVAVILLTSFITSGWLTTMLLMVAVAALAVVVVLLRSKPGSHQADA